MDIVSSSDGMDIDMSFASISSSAPEPPSPLSAAPTITQFNVNRHYADDKESASPKEQSLSNLFYESASPRRRSIEGTRPQFSRYDEYDISIDETPEKPLSKKKRSLSPQSSLRKDHYLLSDDALSSSPALMSSPSVHKLERLNSKPVIRPLAIGGTLALNVNNKRPRKPTSAIITPGDIEGLRSALPQMESVAGNEDRQRERIREADSRLRPVQPTLPPVRRAFSAMIPPSINPMDQSFSEEDSSLSIDGPDMSSPAQAYAKRQQVKTIRRCDGTDDFRSVTGATALLKRDGEARRTRPEKAESPAAGERTTPRSKYLTGLGGFGDNEANGKILPCQRVREDGLMRINVETVRLIDLLE
jgi:M-phase inducer tyrosine phosphatase